MNRANQKYYSWMGLIHPWISTFYSEIVFRRLFYTSLWPSSNLEEDQKQKILWNAASDFFLLGAHMQNL